tara:strand:+ start:4254 stop:4481 length:228 start_codon:yes stop_codon:yes gene_type:complete
MGSLFGSRTPRKTEAEKELEQERLRRIREEEAERDRLALEAEKEKGRRAKGLVGMRSLFSRAGGKGFFYEGKEVE